MIRMIQHLPVDSACDQMAKSFIHDSLPPVLSDGASTECPVSLKPKNMIILWWENIHVPLVYSSLNPKKILVEGLICMINIDDWKVRFYVLFQKKKELVYSIVEASCIFLCINTIGESISMTWPVFLNLNQWL